MSWFIPTALIETTVHRFLDLSCRLLPMREAIRLMMGLDAKLYELQGRVAVGYGKGVHPKHRLTKYHDFFVGRVGKGERVLDVGCGIGAVAFDIAERCEVSVVGIDLNSRNILEAKSRFAHQLVRYIHGDALTNLPSAECDVIILSNVLEHIEYREEFLRNLAKVTRARKFLIRVPMFERDWRVPLKQELGIDNRLDQTHFIEYTHETFADEMHRSGFAIVHLESRWGELWCEVIETSERPLSDTRENGAQIQ